MGSELPGSVHARGEELLASGASIEAWRHYGPLLVASPTDVELHEGAARALVAVLADRPDELGDPRAVDPVLRLLIDQAHVAVEPPVLQRLVVNYHTNGSKDILARAGAAFDHALRGLCRAESVSKNVTMMLLLLREHLGGGITQETISSHHARWVGAFSLPDLTLPYSCVFDDVSFRRNRSDIEALLGTLHSVEDRMRLSLVHLVVFEWLTGRDAVGRESELIELVDRQLGAGVPPQDAAAARSLAARHLRGSSPEARALAERLGDEFGELCAAGERRRAEAASGRSSTGSGDRTRGPKSRLDDRKWQIAAAAANAAASRIGRVVPARRRKVRVAVCVSGQLRGYRHAFASWNRSFLRAVDCDLYVHTWTNVGRSSAEPFRSVLPFAGERFAEAYRHACLRLGFDEVQARYPALFHGLTETAVVDERDLRSLYRTDQVVVEDDTAQPFIQWSNQDKMHRKIGACFAMAMSSGRDYDLVVRIRPDKPVRLLGFFWPDMASLCGSRPRMYADHAMGVHYANLLIGDQFAVGSPESMKVYSETWETYPTLAANGLLQCPEDLHGHASLAQVCWVHGIEVSKAPVKFGPLQETTPLDSGAILGYLRRDADERMDEVDRELLDAVGRDLAPTAAGGRLSRLRQLSRRVRPRRPEDRGAPR